MYLFITLLNAGDHPSLASDLVSQIKTMRIICGVWSWWLGPKTSFTPQRHLSISFSFTLDSLFQCSMWQLTTYTSQMSFPGTEYSSGLYRGSFSPDHKRFPYISWLCATPPVSIIHNILPLKYSKYFTVLTNT